MVLHTRGRVGSRRFLKKPIESNPGGLFLYNDVKYIIQNSKFKMRLRPKTLNIYRHEKHEYKSV